MMKMVKVNTRFAKGITSVAWTFSALLAEELFEDHTLQHWIGNITLSTSLVPYVQQYLAHKTAIMSTMARYTVIITIQRNSHSVAMDVRQRS